MEWQSSYTPILRRFNIAAGLVGCAHKRCESEPLVCSFHERLYTQSASARPSWSAPRATPRLGFHIASQEVLRTRWRDPLESHIPHNRDDRDTAKSLDVPCMNTLGTPGMCSRLFIHTPLTSTQCPLIQYDELGCNLQNSRIFHRSRRRHHRTGRFHAISCSVY
ncbi:hypothetical protein BC628DRAFT_497579 [Trametes gibbosa]|nr:hypothetical protein BC628DRAFT_497579 [Trametes gibbosa]